MDNKFYNYTDSELDTIVKFGKQLEEEDLQTAVQQAKKYIELRKRGLRSEKEEDKEIQESVRKYLKNRIKKD